MRTPILALVVVALAAGCIPKGRYEELLLQKEELERRVNGMAGALDDMADERHRLEADRDGLARQLADARRDLAAKVAETGALQEDIDEMQEALTELETRKAAADSSLQEYRELVSRFQALIDAGTLRVKVIDGRMIVELATDILFPAGSATLSRQGRASIADVAEVLAAIPDREYQVAGHTDDVPIASERFPSNWHLGAARAIAVAQILVESGLPADRVSAASYAEYRPADTNRTREGRAANRRIEIAIVPDLSSLPGYEELEALGNEPE